MAARKAKKVDYNKLFLEAFTELAQAKGLEEADLQTALEDALKKALVKELNSGDDALIHVAIDLENGTIDLAHQKYVVAEVEDDFLEIELTEAQKVNPELKLGDLYRIPYNVRDLSKPAINVMMSYFQQVVSRLEKAALYEEYADKIGELITGVVETIDENGANIKFGPNNVIYLSRSHMIPGEDLEVNKPVKVYVVDVESTSKGAQIKISRTHEGFLKRIMEEEIQELYDGTIVIKRIVREAGSRAKVAVYTTDPDVDPIGACIGPNGMRIQKVVMQLGNGPEKEKIDVIIYNENPALFIIEALRPANVRGLIFDADKPKSVTAVVENGNLSVAIGRRGVNVRLAVKLTGYQIEVKENDEALALGLRPVTKDEFLAEELRLLEVAEREAELLAMEEVVEEPALEVSAVASEQVVIPATPVPEVAIEEKPVISQVEEPVVAAPEVKIQKVKTTKTLEELEAELDAEKAKSQAAPKRKTSRKPVKTEEEVEEDSLYKESERMDIYTEEELAAFEAEESEELDYDYDEDDEFWDEEADKFLR
ncbi:MAG: transcription termination factor NusA [Bacilli bacterium]